MIVPWRGHEGDIRKIIFESGITAIEDAAFSGYEQVTSVKIAGTVENIGRWAFSCCEKLSSVTMEDGVQSIGKQAFAQCDALKAVDFPASVTSLGEGLFEESGLESFAFPKHVADTGSEIFYNCRNLKTVSFLGISTKINPNTFVGCPRLTTIKVPSASKLYTVSDGVLFNKAKTTLVYYPAGKTATSYKVPAGVKTIGQLAFFDNKVLTKVTFPASLTTIGINAFAECNKLKTIGFSTDLKQIKARAFASCTALKRVDLPIGLVTIGDYAFAYCNALATVTIPATVTSIGSWAFAYTSIRTLRIPSSVETLRDCFGYDCPTLYLYGAVSMNADESPLDNETGATIYYKKGTASPKPDGYDGPYTFKTWAPKMAAPVVTLTEKDGDTVSLSWKAIPCAARYQI